MPRDDKDTIMKALTGALSEDSLKVLGIAGVRVAKPLPTELDTLKQHVDMLWQMDDGRLFHLEFQTNRESSLHRFLMYDARLAEQYKVRIRTVILYHGNIKDAPEELNIGTAQYHVENVYLGSFDGDAALDTVELHLRAHDWAPQDRFRLALALNMQFIRPTRAEAFDTVINLVERVPNERERDAVAAAILALTERTLTNEERIRMEEELIHMSKMAEEIHAKGEKLGEHNKAVQVAQKLLKEGWSVDKVSSFTELSLQDVENIRQRL